MADSTRIKLPLGIRTERLMAVMARSLGGHFEATPLRPNADVSQPASDENCWSMSLVDPKFKFSSRDPEVEDCVISMHFSTFQEQDHSWYLHLEADDEKHMQLLPNSTPLAVAMGIRLVKFFGGTLAYDTAQDKTNRTVSLAKAQLSITADLSEFTNALNAIRPLSSLEMFRAIPLAGRKNELGTEKIIAACRRLERQAEIDAHLPKSATARPQHRF